jgi:hypothetical protein
VGLVNFNVKAVEPKEVKAKGRKKSPPKLKPNAEKRRPITDEEVYGEDLFQKAYIPAKSIVICFLPFTKNRIRVSKCGEFAIKCFYKEEKVNFLIFRFLTPIEYEYKEEEEFVIEKSENIKTYGPFETIKEIEDTLIKIKRAEYFRQKEKELAELIAVEKINKEAKEKAQNDAEKLAEQFAESSMARNSTTDSDESSPTLEGNSQTSQVQKEIDTKEISNATDAKENGKSAIELFTKVEEQ